MKLLIIIFLQLVTVSAIARKDTLITYYNSSYEIVKKKEYWSIYRKAFLNADNTIGVIDFYRTGGIKMKGAYLTKDMEIRTGLFLYYDAAGNKIKEGKYDNDDETGLWKSWLPTGERIDEGEYKNGKQHGIWKCWYKSGQQKYTGNYVNGKMDGDWKVWHKNGVLKSIGLYDAGNMHGDWKAWFDNGNIDYEGNYQYGLKEGDWKFYFPSGKMSASETYLKGKATKVSFWNEDGSDAKVTGELEIDPSFIGGASAMNKFIQENIIYPEIARELDIQGIVYVKFTVTTDGACIDFEVIMGVDPLLDNEALRVLQLMPKWRQGISHNRILDLDFVLPINFRIQ